MNQKEFEEIFDGLPLRRTEVLLKLLSGSRDKEIAEALKIYEGTVRKELSALQNDFKLKKFQEGVRARRSDLINLFLKYKPELVKKRMPKARKEYKKKQKVPIELACQTHSSPSTGE